MSSPVTGEGMRGLIEAERRGEQLALIPEAAPAGDEARGPGRPPGAKNRATRQTAEWFLSRFMSPLEGAGKLISAYFQDPAKFCDENSLNRADALKLVAQLMRDVAPYVHRRQPIALESGGGGLAMALVLAPPETSDQDVMDVVDLNALSFEGEGGEDES